MIQPQTIPRGTPALALLLGVVALLAIVTVAAQPIQPPSLHLAHQQGAAFENRLLRGRVVWLDEALSRLHHIAVEPDTAHTAVALESPDGHLWPLVLDTRGRAFMVDGRLREMDVVMLVRAYADSGMAQVIRLYESKPDGLYEIDYWCDVCAIPMYILKPCECCQGPTRLREQKIEGPLPKLEG
jgi:hypothetical protein